MLPDLAYIKMPPGHGRQGKLSAVLPTGKHVRVSFRDSSPQGLLLAVAKLESKYAAALAASHPGESNVCDPGTTEASG
jgi:hypothetical protein